MTFRNLNPIHFLARYWFPMALVTLMILAIPGVILFVLYLRGQDSVVNEWLEDHYQLSYHLSIPTWAASVILLVPLALVLLYLLKLKRKSLAVPSTFLWRKSIEDLHVNSLLQWLRQNVLLLLQILALLALIYGLMAFRFHGRTGEGKHYIIMIDNSASMAASDVEPSRLEWAKKEALQEIDGYSDTDFGMVIVFNSSAEILQSYTNQRGTLRRAVEGIPQTQRPTRIDEALSLADSLANPTRSTENEASRPANEQPGKERTYAPAEGMSAEVHLYSDGRFPPVPDFSLGNLNLQFHVAGKVVLEAPGAATPGGGREAKPVLKPDPDSSDNIGLVTLNAKRDDSDPRKLLVFATVMNFRPTPVRSTIQLEVLTKGDLTGIYEKTIDLPARRIKVEKEGENKKAQDLPGEGSVNFDLENLDDQNELVLHAKLKNYELSSGEGNQPVLGDKIKDKFPLDDDGWLVVGVIRKSRVLIVGKPNPVLTAFFEDDATREVAEITTMDPADLDKDSYQKDARNGAFDLIIFDRCGPKEEKDMPRSNTFFIGYPPPPWKLDAKNGSTEAKSVEAVVTPYVTGWLNKHPALRYLSALHEVGIENAFQMTDLPQRTPRLLEGNGNTILILTLNRGSFTDLVQAFPILTDDDPPRWNTDWPLRPSFPLFLRNVLYYLGNISDAAFEENVQPGQVKTLRPDQAVRRIEVAPPSGKLQVLEQKEGGTFFSFGGTDQVGIYRVQWEGGGQRSFAVNLLDAEESNIEPRSTIQIGAESLVAGRETHQPREMWKWFAVAALLLLLLEWYIYNKRIYI
jgi:hypothetical protein